MRREAASAAAPRRPSKYEEDDGFNRVYLEVVHRYLGARVDADVTEELTAQTFVQAWAGRDAFDPHRGTRAAWLCGIAANLLRHHLRDERRRTRAHIALAAQRGLTSLADSFQDDVLDAMATLERAAAVSDALGRVDGTDREMLLLAAQPDVTYRVMADKLGIPVGTVRSRLYRARRHLLYALNNR